MVYTLDGSEPTPNSTAYTAPIEVSETATVKIASVLPSGKMSPIRTIEVIKQELAPAADGDLKGTIYQYEFYVSNDGNNWTKCEASNEFSNIMHNPIPYFVRFGKAYNARYFKLVPTAEINGQQCTSIGEVGILTK